MHPSLVLLALTLLLLVPVRSAQRPSNPAPAEERQVKKLKVGDVDLAYVEEGKGEPVVFVHGALGDWRTWEQLRPFISERYRYISLSRRYHYPNPWLDDGRKYSQAQHVEDLAAFVRELNAGRVHLVGNSGGGRLAGFLALKYPELVRSVVLGEPGGLVAPAPAEGKAPLAAGQDPGERIHAAIDAGDLRQAVMLFYDRAVGQQGAFEKLPADRQQRRLDNARTLRLGAAIPVACEQLASLRAPALVVRGGKSGWRHETLLGCLPKTTELAVIPGAHHAWNDANPEASAKAILAFLAKQGTPTEPLKLPPGIESLRVNRYDMAYVQQGTGQPVLLVPGSLSDFRYWSPAMVQLSATHRVIAVSLRHYYPEQWDGRGNDFSMRQHVADLAAFIQKLGAGPVHLVGLSRGASLAMYLASAHRQLVRTVTLAEPNMARFDEDAQRLPTLFEKSLAFLERGNVDGALEYFVDYVNGPGSWKGVKEAERQMFRANVWTLGGEARDRWDRYTCADARRIEAPVLLLGGEKSPPLFGKVLDAIQACLKQSERSVVRNASHGMPRQNPAGFSQAVRRFIAKHANAPSPAVHDETTPVTGRELAAAVNLHQKDMKADGTLFPPQEVRQPRAVIVVMNHGDSERVYQDPEWRKAAEALESALLHVRISHIGSSARTLISPSGRIVPDVPPVANPLRNAAVDGAADALLTLLDPPWTFVLRLDATHRSALEIAAHASFSGSQSDASWLPDETSARAWRAISMRRAAGQAPTLAPRGRP